MVTITLLILFNRKKYESDILPSLEQLKKGNIEHVEKLIKHIDKNIVVDFWDFSDIPEEDSEFSGFFEDFVNALEEEIIQSKQIPENIDKAKLRRMIIDMVKGSKGKDIAIPDEILKRITGITNSTEGYKDTSDYIKIDNDIDDDEPIDKIEEAGILKCEMEEIIEQVKKTKKADPDTIMYFKARLIEGFCIPVNKVRYRYDLTGNLLNVFLFSMSKELISLLKDKKSSQSLLPKLAENDRDLTEDIFDNFFNQDNIIELMALLDNLTTNFNQESEFDNIDRILRKNIKGEWWNRMSMSDKRIRIKNWWDETENLKMFLQGAIDHGYDILVSTI